MIIIASIHACSVHASEHVCVCVCYNGFFCSILPTKAVDIIGEFLGTNRAMDTFVGNQKSE